VFCPVPSTLEKPLKNVSRLIVKGYDANTNGGVTAEACVKFKDSLGGYCGPLRASFVDPTTWAGGASTGNFSLTLDASYTYPFTWWPDAFGFLHVGLKSDPGQGMAPDHFYGYTIADQIVIENPLPLPQL
jgi:hypothetical protein